MLRIKDDYFVLGYPGKERIYFHFENILAISLRPSYFKNQEEFDKAEKDGGRGLPMMLLFHRIIIISLLGGTQEISYDAEKFSECEADFEKLILAHQNYFKKIEHKWSDVENIKKIIFKGEEDIDLKRTKSQDEVFAEIKIDTPRALSDAEVQNIEHKFSKEIAAADEILEKIKSSKKRFFKKKYKHDFDLETPEYKGLNTATLDNNGVLQMNGCMIYTCKRCGKTIILKPGEMNDLPENKYYGCIKP